VSESVAPFATQALLEAAWGRRAALHDDPELDVYRLFHGHGDGAPGCTIDRIGEGWVATGPEAWLAALPELVAAAGQTPAWLIGRARPGPGVPRMLLGAQPPERLTVTEHGLCFELEPMASRNVGLYLDTRHARRWIREQSKGRLILNLFAYTGSLGVAAAVGGARGVTHMDMQKRALRRIRTNLELNGQRADGRDLMHGDLYAHLRKMAKGSRRFDGIILDPPPQVPGRGAHRPAGQDYETLLPATLPLLSPDGWLLCFFSRRNKSQDACERAILDTAGLPLEVMVRGTSGEDYPENDPSAKLAFSAFSWKS
jgi:23S rRNA (cytosine1962-C5)-methyltransferase